jgi:single-stranded-DNA-specific exonuclease
VDNGITSFEAAKICKEKGIELIITDHHTPLKNQDGEFLLPDALIVNPKTSPEFPFKEICGAEVAWYLCAAIKHQKKIKADLIITVDNGITSFEAAKICKEKGIELIITDHHTPLKNQDGEFLFPDALIVNPKTSPEFPFKEICGAEVAWYLCAAIKHQKKLNVDLRKYLDILAIAIIADVMPLTHINRTLVQMGLKRLNRGISPFARALKRFFNKKFDSEFIAFQIAPRLNAAGRVAHAKSAYKFLISKDDEEAFRLLLELDGFNNLRKEIEKEIVESIEVDENDNFLVAYGDYHEGVIGIIASRLVHKYKKPAIVFSKNGEYLKGSGRSLGNIDIFELVKDCGDILEGFGGHKMACGLSIKKENIERFKKRINALCEKYDKEDFFIEDFVLGELPFSEIDLELVDILKEFEPYGEANPKPKFIAKAKIEHIQNLKDNHYKLILSQDGILHQGLIFRFDGEFGEEVVFKFSIGENNYYGREVQLMIEEIKNV